MYSWGSKIKIVYLIMALFQLTSCGETTSFVTTPTLSTPILQATSSTTDKQTQWLKTNAIPFNSTEPNNSFEDLRSLTQIVGNARIVALGEATHGTHEFFQMKYRMLKFLIEEMGFTTFAIEANEPEANLINEYIHTGKGDPKELLKGLHFWTWNTQEVLDMIQWMRAYNENPENISKISFFGFDMQYDQMARDNVTHYLQQVDPQAIEQLSENYTCFPRPSTDCTQKFQTVYDWINQHQTDYIIKSSLEEFTQALHNARILVQYADLNKYNPTTDADYSYKRDQYMAENVIWLLEQAGPDTKIVLWAHNGHVGTFGENSSLSMGDYLRKRYGQQMIIFGILFYQGSFNAYGEKNLQVFQVDLPPTNSYEYYFYSTGLPGFLLDLRSIKAASPETEWFFTNHPFRMIGSGYDPHDSRSNFIVAILKKVFDVIIYIQDTSPSLLLN